MAIKIAFVTNTCDHFSVKPFERLSTKYDVDFYFTGGDERWRPKGNKSYRGNFKGTYLKKINLLGLRITPGIFKLMFRPYDVFIKSFDDRFALPVIFLMAKLKRTPFIFWSGTWSHPKTLFHRLSFIFTKFIYRFSEANLVYGEHIKRYLIDLKIDQKKIFVEHHAMDNDDFSQPVSQETKVKLKQKFNITDEKIVLYVGRIEDCKGLQYLVEVIGLSKNLNCYLLFIGSGDLKEALEKECKERNIKHCFLGYVPNEELRNYYGLADVFVLPSITTKTFKEPWGIVVNEAMNQGCPIVATDAVGAAAGGLVQQDRNGVIVPEADSVAMGRALELLLGDDELRARMSQASREIIKEWSPQQMVVDFSRAIEFVYHQSKH